jgi:DNA-binding NarL/FixJ family response regulator
LPSGPVERGASEADVGAAITVVLAHFDGPAFGSWLRAHIESDERMRVVASETTAAAAAQLRSLVVEHRPDVAVLNGDALSESEVACFARTYPGTRILVLTSAAMSGRERLARVGVAGCLPIGSSLDEIAGAIVTVAGGESVLGDRPWPLYRLTTRELQVYEELSSGQSDAEIALALSRTLNKSVTLSTVRTHVQNIFRKFEVRDRRELIDHELIATNREGSLMRLDSVLRPAGARRPAAMWAGWRPRPTRQFGPQHLAFVPGRFA